VFHALNWSVIKAAIKSGTQENLTTAELQMQSYEAEQADHIHWGKEAAAETS